MSENMVSMSKDEYAAILERAYKAVMLKEALLNCATLSVYEDGLFFGSSNIYEVGTIFKYVFPTDYDDKLVELKDKRKAKEGADDER